MTQSSHPQRRQFLVFVMSAAATSIFSTAVTANVTNEAEGFAQEMIDNGFAILRDEHTDRASRRARFHAFILGHIEARKTAMFTLGVYRRGASDAVLANFTSVFAEYSTAIYETHLEDYRAATLKVVGSTETKTGDVVVNTQATDPSFREPVGISFRLTKLDGRYKIVDVQVAGIWLSVEQREQFTAALGRNNGDIAALAVQLEERTVRIRAGESPN